MALNLGGVLSRFTRRAQRAPASVEQERATSFSNLAAQVMEAIRDELEEMDPDSWHWLQDLYVDDQDLFAVTVSGGRLYRWPITVDGTTVTIGDPAIVEIEFKEDSEQKSEDRRQRTAGRSMVRQAPDGSWYGVSVMCTATVNKMGILDSRQLFDSFVQRFTGKEEYINILHLGGASSKIGEMRHIFRDDKLLVGFYTFTKDDPIAEAAALTLANDEAGLWGGSIEFLHYGELEKVTVAEGIELPVTKDGKFLGYSFALSADCAAWNTCNLVQERLAMTEKDKKIARQLLGSDELVEELAKRLGETNRTMEGAVTYTVVRSQESSGALWAPSPESTVNSPSSGESSLPETPDSGLRTSDLQTYELDAEAIEQLSNQVIERVNFSTYEQRWQEDFGELSRVVQAAVEDLGKRLVEMSGLVNGQAEAFEKRMATLEADEATRYQEYDAQKPKQPAIKVGVRPRASAGSANGLPAVAIDVRQESSFAARARDRRAGKA